MVGAPRSGWLERWGELAILLTVWLLAAATTWGLSRVTSLRQAFRLRALAGSSIARVLEAEPAFARVRGRPGDPGPGGGPQPATRLSDDTGSLLVDATAPAGPGPGTGPAATPEVLEAVGCYQGTRLRPCAELPLLLGTPAEVRAAQRDLARAAALKLAVVLAILAALLYVVGRLLGAPLGRRLPAAGKRPS
ncbi:MAG: hypothetical protein IT370_35800 [Deltaproteobacteria bacterium]|nr:hypothetical protein [Deltaproteobacteria bacterium]